MVPTGPTSLGLGHTTRNTIIIKSTISDTLLETGRQSTVPDLLTATRPLRRHGRQFLKVHHNTITACLINKPINKDNTGS